ncbi:hypothetical protein AVEN_51982-1 [Araneus ventricosus]|uniref:Uncharacterized protein n=1 Tax=Araneus ventricosus TaxID=182803 RepID=A0A4Y2CED7_ARAVE|nr:hypothetical protein AVEN_51982-1 [Araneus ventricosus]
MLHVLPSSVSGTLYVDDLQISCQGSNMNLIERQLQRAMNKLLAWCDQKGDMISPEKSCCVQFCRKRSLHPDPAIQIQDANIPVVEEQILLHHRHQYSAYIPIFTDGSKTANYVGYGDVIADVTSSFQLNALCSVLTAELTAIFLALERISDLLNHKYCIYSDSKSALEALRMEHIRWL